MFHDHDAWYMWSVGIWPKYLFVLSELALHLQFQTKALITFQKYKKSNYFELLLNGLFQFQRILSVIFSDLFLLSGRK